jgi:hypothetical protein
LNSISNNSKEQIYTPGEIYISTPSLDFAPRDKYDVSPDFVYELEKQKSKGV